MQRRIFTLDRFPARPAPRDPRGDSFNLFEFWNVCTGRSFLYFLLVYGETILLSMILFLNLEGSMLTVLYSILELEHCFKPLITLYLVTIVISLILN